MTTTTTTAIAELPEGAAAAVREIRDLSERAVTHAPIALLDGVQQHLVPDGYTSIVTDVRPPLRASKYPDRRRGEAVLQELEPFVRYTNLHRDPEATTVWTDYKESTTGASSDPVGSITAIIDDHAPAGEAGWGEHRAVLHLVTSPEWRHWLSGDGRLGNQMALAEHLEDGVAEIVQPDAATVLDVVQTIQVTRGVEFKSSARTRDGQIQFTYAEDQEAKAGNRGDLPIPEIITLHLAAFPGGQKVELTARLRYRITEGKLQIGYKLERPADVLRQATHHYHAELLEQLEEDLHDRVFRGRPIPARVREGDHPELTFHSPPRY